ncbi:uncharacterized protein LOC134218522 [Armigeres subalbatus]|uniref:uncharacterized protein LOC134218522 n=1 Tax=Armigeres subalbatus TaxID=124917 RepID=UPI002ED2ECA2
MDESSEYHSPDVAESNPATMEVVVMAAGTEVTTVERKPGESRNPSKRSIIRNYTQELFVNGKHNIRCVLVDNCEYSQKLFLQTNFERHFRLCHPAAYELLCIGPAAAKHSSSNAEPAITIRMTKQRLIGGVVKMVTIHGLPFEFTEWDGFQEIVEPLLKAFNLTVNRHNIKQYVAKAAEGIDCLIIQELHGLMISLKMDIVSKMYRSMLGINCQYINNTGAVVKRNLGIIELHNRHTSQYLKDELLKILKFFGVDVCQIVAVTIDNASNMVKLVKLLSALSESAIDYYVDSEQFEKIPLNEIEVDDSDVLDIDSPEKLVDQEWARVLEDFAPDEFITAVRCGAHTTQLVVHDVCKQSVHKAALREIRKKVKKFRSTEYKTFFDVSEGGTYPPLPNETRWNSNYKMLLELSKGRSFFEKLGTQYPDLDLSNYWGFIEDYVTAFNPLYQCTIAV